MGIVIRPLADGQFHIECDECGHTYRRYRTGALPQHKGERVYCCPSCEDLD